MKQKGIEESASPAGNESSDNVPESATIYSDKKSDPYWGASNRSFPVPVQPSRRVPLRGPVR